MQEENGAYQDQMNTILSDYVNINQIKKTHFVKSVQIQSFFCPYISVFSPNAGNYGPEKNAYLNNFHAVITTRKYQSSIIHEF